jgi:hypothetical protein
MQANYRTILREVLLAQAAAAGAFADVAARYAVLVGQEYQAALSTLAAAAQPKDGPAHPAGGSGIPGGSLPRSADFGRALAGLPRISMMVFLSQYNSLRGRRGVVRD